MKDFKIPNLTLVKATIIFKVFFKSYVVFEERSLIEHAFWQYRSGNRMQSTRIPMNSCTTFPQTSYPKLFFKNLVTMSNNHGFEFVVPSDWCKRPMGGCLTVYDGVAGCNYVVYDYGARSSQRRENSFSPHVLDAFYDVRRQLAALVLHQHEIVFFYFSRKYFFIPCDIRASIFGPHRDQMRRCEC